MTTRSSTPGVSGEPSIPVAQIRAAVALLSPDEMTPTAKRMLLSICDEHDQEREPSIGTYDDPYDMDQLDEEAGR